MNASAPSFVPNLGEGSNNNDNKSSRNKNNNKGTKSQNGKKRSSKYHVHIRYNYAVLNLCIYR